MIEISTLSRARTAQLGIDYLPTLARFTLTATLFVFFWRSAMTKFGDGLTGLWTPSLDAYVQILPWRMEAVGYDPGALGVLDTLVVIAGMWAEVLLPILIAVGLFTRLSALGMIGFVLVMTLVDHLGHGVALGSWFDGRPDAVLLDQRLYWLLALALLALLGGGRLSLDRLWQRYRQQQSPTINDAHRGSAGDHAMA